MSLMADVIKSLISFFADIIKLLISFFFTARWLL